MDSRLRTKILYEDPNSIFKSGKKVYLHELQGATLKTSRPTPDDITIGLKGAESMVGLISQLSQLQNIVYFFYTQIYERTTLYSTYNEVSLRDANKIMTLIKSLISKLNKLSPNIFNEDDVFTLLSFNIEISDYLQLIATYLDNDLDPDYYAVVTDMFFKTSSFKKFIDNVDSVLYENLNPFIKSINLTGLSVNSNINIIDPERQNIIEPPDEPIDLPPAEPLDGAGRFRVLSDRIRKRQPMPLKRFL